MPGFTNYIVLAGAARFPTNGSIRVVFGNLRDSFYGGVGQFPFSVNCLGCRQPRTEFIRNLGGDFNVDSVVQLNNSVALIDLVLSNVVGLLSNNVYGYQPDAAGEFPTRNTSCTNFYGQVFAIQPSFERFAYQAFSRSPYSANLSSSGAYSSSPSYTVDRARLCQNGPARCLQFVLVQLRNDAGNRGCLVVNGNYLFQTIVQGISIGVQLFLFNVRGEVAPRILNAAVADEVSAGYDFGLPGVYDSRDLDQVLLGASYRVVARTCRVGRSEFIALGSLAIVVYSFRLPNRENGPGG